MKNKLYILVSFFFAVILFGSCSNCKVKYKQNIDETYVSSKNIQLIDVNKLAEIIYSESSDYIFVDIRTPHEYSLMHIDSAVNIPFDVLKEDNLKMFCSNDKVFLIYGHSTTDARLAVSYLNQLGIYNVMAVGGGFDYIWNNIIENFGIYSSAYDDEIALYDYKKIIDETPKGNTSSSNNVSNVQFVPVTKKNEKSSGGCQ